MDNPLQRVTIGGEERELLYTLSLYKVLNDRKQQIVIEKGASWVEVTNAFLRVMYAAHLNAIQVRQIDDPAYNPTPAKFMDFVIWSESNNKEFTHQFKLCYKFITGKELDEDIKKKTIPTQEEAKMQKKTSIWSKIGGIFKISS
jgi:hypothetical protein